jgi:hypothetical protein
LLLEEEFEHACPWQSAGQRGGLLVRALRPQPVQQPSHADRGVEGDLGGGTPGQRGAWGHPPGA